jgi:hypothetical protein
MIEIHVQLKRMPWKMEGAGCVRESKLVVDNVEKEEVVFHLCSNNKVGHCIWASSAHLHGTPLCIFQEIMSIHTSIPSSSLLER